MYTDLRKENTIYNPKTNSSPLINFAYFFFQISPTNKDSVPSAAKVAWQRTKLVIWHDVEKWLMISHQLPPLQPSGLWIRRHSYLASFTHVKDSLKNRILNILLRNSVNAYGQEKWGNFWRTSHHYTSMIPHFHVMYFNVWINSNVKLSSYSWILVFSSLLTLIKPFNLSLSLVSPLLKLIHLPKIGTIFLRNKRKKNALYKKKKMLWVHRSTMIPINSNSASSCTYTCLGPDPFQPGQPSSTCPWKVIT